MAHTITILLFIGCIVLSVILYKDIKYLAENLWK
jgi:hypothetical protein